MEMHFALSCSAVQHWWSISLGFRRSFMSKGHLSFICVTGLLPKRMHRLDWDLIYWLTEMVILALRKNLPKRTGLIDCYFILLQQFKLNYYQSSVCQYSKFLFKLTLKRKSIYLYICKYAKPAAKQWHYPRVPVGLQ